PEPAEARLAETAKPDENIDAIVGGASAATPAAAPAQTGQAAQAGQGSQSGGAPNQAVADTRESAGKSPVPQSPPQSQGEASTPPQQKSGGQTAPPPTAPPRPAAPPA